MRRTKKPHHSGEKVGDNKHKIARHRHQASVKKNQTRHLARVRHRAKIHRERGVEWGMAL